MKEIFIKFLKDNNFYEGWMEGYRLDNEIYNDNIPLDEFFDRISPCSWLYSGPEALAMLCYRPKENKELQKRYDEWRRKYSSLYSDLDIKWMELEKEIYERTSIHKT